ncbi:PREDICTED: bidirectional sugar transporter SWEET4-like [Lupinus angustifolius]|uniref:bidirectional sugar transporter SWEET4-like n=1 Tax=Lupinus angustifolius TaxID=3871 RepID=UPI00092F1CEA|nr:PREDICTED: bidirectional sugar transporter SWEET4-like [Lupinus angustifolius]
MTRIDIAHTIFGIIGNILGVILFLSPVPTFVAICKKGSVEQYSVAPYLATLMSCMVGVLYGLPLVHPHRLLVATIAASGCILQTIYVTIFFIFSDRIKRLKVIMWLLFELIFITILIIVTLIGVHNLKTRSEIVGTISVALTIMMYASPLAIMKMVVKTKSVEYMPLFISLASFGNSVAWTTYALISFDPFLTISNGAGTLLGVAQLILYAIYYNSTKQQIVSREGNMEMNLSQVVVDNVCQETKPNK